MSLAGLLREYGKQVQQALLATTPLYPLLEWFLRGYQERRRVFLIGNGGCEALARHFATDLQKGLGFRALSLAENSALVTALSNDVAYDDLFAEQLKVLADPGDHLFFLSCSGQSANILRAIHESEKMSVGGLVAFKRGQVPSLDTVVYVPTMNYQVGEDCFHILCHFLYTVLKSRLKGDA